MNISRESIRHWLPRRFVSRSAKMEREAFEASYGQTLFLLVKLKSYSDPLALGLEATTVTDSMSGRADDLAGVLGGADPTAFATKMSVAMQAFSSQKLDDWIATPMADEPRFVVPLKKRVADGTGKILVGRSYGCDIVLREQSVSKFHSRFAYDEGRCLLEDCQSKNGTAVDGKRITGPVEVRPGAVIHFGRIEARLCSPVALWKRIASA